MSEPRTVIPDGMQVMYDNLHFAPAVAHGDRLFCSGQTGGGADGKLSDDPEAQIAQAFENVKAVLEAGGSSLSDILEMTTFHVGFDEHIRAFMTVKDRFVEKPYPAWTAIGVSGLAFGALVEIKVVARIPGS